MNRPAFFSIGIGLIVDCLAQQIENTAQAFIAHRHGDGAAGIHSFQAAHHTVRSVHGNAAGYVIPYVLRHFSHDFLIAIHDFDGCQKFGQVTVFKADIQHRPDNLYYFTDILITQSTFLLSDGHCSAPATISVISCVMAP